MEFGSLTKGYQQCGSHRAPKYALLLLKTALEKERDEKKQGMQNYAFWSLIKGKRGLEGENQALSDPELLRVLQ